MRRLLSAGGALTPDACRPFVVGVRVAALLIVLLAVTPADAGAAVVGHSSTALGAITVFVAFLVVREWPVALTGSLWAVGTLFAAAFWLTRTRFRPAWFPVVADQCARVESDDVESDDVLAPHLRPRHVVSPSSAAVITAARRCFIELQSAWDAGDVERMRSHTTAEMLVELLQELPNRGSDANRTDILTLQAALLMLEPVGTRLLASVEFSGMIRESIDEGAKPFREVWMLTCLDAAEPQWRLARQQALM